MTLMLTGLAACAAGCLGMPTESGTADLLAALPEASLVYPDAHLQAGPGEFDAAMTTKGRVPAHIKWWYGTNSPIEDIHAFYDLELVAAGWEVAPGGGSRTTTELEAWAWRKDGLSFRVGISDPDKTVQSVEGSEEFQTKFRVNLSGPRSEP